MTTDQLRDTYLAHVSKEPPQDAGQHPSMDLHEQVGNTWAKWERTRQALWTMLGDALTEDFLGQSIVLEW